MGREIMARTMFSALVRRILWKERSLELGGRKFTRYYIQSRGFIEPLKPANLSRRSLLQVVRYVMLQ
jgi:hypothetical protein